MSDLKRIILRKQGKFKQCIKCGSENSLKCLVIEINAVNFPSGRF